MKKLLTCFLSIVMLLTLVCSLSACSTNDVKIEYHIDNFTLDISVPEGTLPENYQEEINKNDFLLENTYDGRTHILVDMTYYDPDVPQDFINPLKESLEKFFPAMKEEIRALSIELTKDYFGTTIPCTRQMRDDEIKGAYEKETGTVIIERFNELNINADDVPGVVVYSHGPFTWGKSPKQAVYHAVVLEEVAKMAAYTRMVKPTAAPAPKHVMDKHYLRKHGPNAYYGQR